MTKKQSPHVVVTAIWIPAPDPSFPKRVKPAHLRAELMVVRDSTHACEKFKGERRVWFAHNVSKPMPLRGWSAEWAIAVALCMQKHNFPIIGIDAEIL